MAITPLAGYKIDPNNPNGVIQIGGPLDVVQPATTVAPIANTTPVSAGLVSYIPTNTETESERLMRQRAEQLATEATPESEADRRTRITNQFQGEIDALNAVYANQKQEAIQRGMGRLGTDAAIQNRRGLIGSTFGTGQTEAVQSANAQDVNAVEAERGAALANVYAKIRQAVAQSEAEKKQAQGTSYEANLAFLKSKETRAQQNTSDFVKTLITSKANVTQDELDKLSQTEEFKKLGIDPVMFKQQYMTALEAEKAKLEKELADQQAAELEAQKIQAAMTKPFDVGDTTWQYQNGNYVNLGLNKIIPAPEVGDMTTRQNVVFNSIMTKYETINKANATFNVAKSTADRIIADPKNAQAQLSNLYQYVKTLDANSAVREGETQLAKDTGSLLNKLQRIEESYLKDGATVGSDLAVKMANEAKALSDAWLRESTGQQNLLRARARTNGIEQQFVDTVGYAEELNTQTAETPTTTKSGQPFDYAKAKESGYSDEEIQAYINSN